MRDIKTKAEQSEAMVHEICRDIKQLDYAKRHLTTTITALKRLQMLVTAVEQLVVMSRERMYAEAANLLEAVTQLLGHFAEYTHIDKVRELSDKVADVRTSLRTQVFDDFNKLSAEDGTPQIGGATFETLTGACAVVDALGPAVRKEMIAWFSNWQFAPYKHTFQPYGECGSLEKTELRYAWFRKLLQAYDDTFAPLFPPSWHVALGVTRDFCVISKAHLDEILDQSRGSLDVALLNAGLTSSAPGEHNLVDPVFPRALRWLSATTVDDVRSLEREEVSQVDGPSSADRRKLWLFCVAQREALEAAVAEATKIAVAEVRELEAVKRAAARPVDPRAAIAFRVPEACFVRVARFLYYAPRPPPTPPPLDAEILGLLEGFVRRPPPPSSPG